MRTVQTLLNMVDFGMNVQQAIEAPRWSTRSFASSVFPHRMSPRRFVRGVAGARSRPEGAAGQRAQAATAGPGRSAPTRRSSSIRRPACSAPAPTRASKPTPGPGEGRFPLLRHPDGVWRDVRSDTRGRPSRTLPSHRPIGCVDGFGNVVDSRGPRQPAGARRIASQSRPVAHPGGRTSRRSTLERYLA